MSMMRFWKSLAPGRRIAAIGLLLLTPAGLYALLRPGEPAAQQAPAASRPPADPIAELQRRMDRGEIRLTHRASRGYLESLLTNLKISPESQNLVFSKSSFELHLISPETPRALYFNDDVYVAWVQGAPFLELVAVHPKEGPTFYTLSQKDDGRPAFRHETKQCFVCHDASGSEGTGNTIPRLLVLSILPDTTGSAIKAFAMVTNDRSPFKERWGGWYITGTHGRQYHMANVTTQTPAEKIKSVEDYIAQMDLSVGANVTNLSDRFDTKTYLTPHSDIVAASVLGHQTHLHNMISLANARFGRGESPASTVGEFIVRTMLFVEAIPFTEPIRGTSKFAEEFSKAGPFDKAGRSLRELDLQTRLFRYPLSYLIYSPAFDGMHPELRDYVYTRLYSVLTGADRSRDMAHLTERDRKAILEILMDTKPDFASFAAKAGIR